MSDTPDSPVEPGADGKQAAAAPSGAGENIKPKSGAKLAVSLGLVVLLAAGGGGYYWWWSHRPAPVKPLKKVTIQLEWLQGAEFAGLFTAAQKGFYKDEGLDVTFKPYTDGVDPAAELVAGHADVGISTPLEVVQARDSGKKVKAIAAIYQTSAYTIVSKKTANIKTPADFRGKVLGNLGANTEATITYAALMASAGVKPSEVTLKDIPFGIADDLTKNVADTGDIYRTDETYLLDQAKVAYNLLYPEQFGFAIYGDVLMASDAKIASDPTTLAAFTKASMKGWQYAVDHQSEALTYTAKYEESDYKNAAYEQHILAATAPLIRPTGGQSFGVMQYVPWNRAYQGVKAAGLLKTNFNASDLYTTQFVE